MRVKPAAMELWDVLLEFNGPMCTTLKWGDDLYIGVAIPHDSWLVAPIDEDTVALIVANAIPVRDVLAVDDTLLLNNRFEPQIYFPDPADIPEDWLPLPDTRLYFDLE